MKKRRRSRRDSEAFQPPALAHSSVCLRERRREREEQDTRHPPRCTFSLLWLNLLGPLANIFTVKCTRYVSFPGVAYVLYPIFLFFRGIPRNSSGKIFFHYRKTITGCDFKGYKRGHERDFFWDSRGAAVTCVITETGTRSLLTHGLSFPLDSFFLRLERSKSQFSAPWIVRFRQRT